MSVAIRLKMTPNNFAELAERFGMRFWRGAIMTHDTWVLRVLEYIAKFCRVDTGRARAGFFAFMDSKGYDYYRSLPPTLNRQVDGTDEGRAMGTFMSQPFNTTIINNVKYVDDMNRRFGLFGFAMTTSGKMYLGSMGIRFEDKVPIFEQYGADNFNRFLEASKMAFEKGGRRFEPGDIPEITNDPPMTQ